MKNDIYISCLKEELRKEEYNEDYLKICVEYASRLLDNSLPVVFDTNHLALLLNVKGNILSKHLILDDYYYREIKIPKKNGGMRDICMPSSSMKGIQRWILDNILYQIPVSKASTAFCTDRSIVTNAKIHLENECVINFDIKDFFPSIKFDEIFRIFYYYGYTKEISFVLAKLCTYKGVLPQGSPASPYLSNIICLKLDKRLQSIANKFDANYTRYADDITISGEYRIKGCMDIVEKIIKDEGFFVNQNKTRISYKHQRQEVTGLLVNSQRVRVNKNYKRKIKQEIYYCLKYGVSDHLRHIECDKSFFKEYLYGKVYFVKMVEPEIGNCLLEELDSINWEY